MLCTTCTMTDQIEKYSVNMETAFDLNAVKDEECHEDALADNKVDISDTAIIRDSSDKLKEEDIYTTWSNIKSELSSSEVQLENPKIEEDFGVDDVKIEFNNGLLYCEDCHVYYKDYCADCGMLVHILNKNTSNDTIKGAELPDDILEIHDYFGHFRTVALKVIPVGVRFGPFTGLNRTDHSWKIKGGKFTVNIEESKSLNWMQYINPARNISEQNLLVLQHERNLYYQSTRQIQVGDELLVYFGEEYEDSLNKDVEMDFIPTREYIFNNAFACTLCCLGFSSKLYLVKHKTICLENAAGESPIEELMQCPSCQIHLNRKEYFIDHMAYCCKRNGRKCILSTKGDPKAQVNGRKTQRRLVYKRQQRKYRTRDKGDLKNYDNRVKMYKCEVCCRRFKTNEVLKLHAENTHICADGKEDLEHSNGDYMKAHVKAEHSYTQDQRKEFKCSLCEFRTKYKLNLKRHLAVRHSKAFKCVTCDYKSNWKHDLERHIETRHSKEFKHKCDTCDFQTNWETNLKRHMATRHLKVFKYKCDTCAYKTNKKSSLKSHTEAKHLKIFKYKCDTCDYKTSQKYQLKSHIETRHLKEFKYKCDSCDFKANQKFHLQSHIQARHLNEFKYKCDRCEYKTNRNSNLKNHIEAKHLKEFKYKCDICDYKANQKFHLKSHIEAIHLREFKYKCGTCEYETNKKSNLENHIKARHLKEFKYKCDTCDYKAYQKYQLRRHIDTKHLNEFKYKCDTCQYKTNTKNHLKSHIEARHLKEFIYNCDICDYKASGKYNLKRHTERKH